MSKRTYYMIMIDGMFRLDACMIYKLCKTLSVVTLKWNDIMGT